MTDEERGFLSAICARQDDDLVRLAYADWLEERNDRDKADVERAEFMRVQIEFDKRPHAREIRAKRYDARDGIDAEWSYGFNLYDRSESLLLEHFFGWTQDLPEQLLTKGCVYCEEGGTDPETGIVECQTCDSTGVVDTRDRFGFGHGMIEHLECTFEEFLGTTCGTCRDWAGRGPTGGIGGAAQPSWCNSCQTSTGRIPGLVATLFRTCPIREVMFLGLRALRTSPAPEVGYAWIDEIEFRGITGRSRDGEIPSELWTRLAQLYPEAVYRGLITWCRFDTEAEADAALSYTAVSLGREAAKLPHRLDQMVKIRRPHEQQ